MPSLSLANALGACIISGGAYDADAVAYFTRVEATGATMTDAQKSAVSTFITSLKANSLYTKINEMWLFIGGAAGAHALGFKNAFNLTFVGSPTHSSNGVAWNGTTQYATTTLSPVAVLNQNSFHLSYYSRTDDISTTQVDIGSRDGGTLNYMDMLARNSDGKMYLENPTGGTLSVAVATGLGFAHANRSGAAAIELYKNGSQITTGTTASGTLPTDAIYIGARNGGGAATFFTKKQAAFASVGSSLNSTEAGQFASAVNTLQTALSRNVY